MQFQVQLLLVYFEQLPRLVEEGFPPTAIGELRALASTPVEATINSKIIPLSLRLLSSEEALAEGYSWRRPMIKWRGEYLAVLEGLVSYDLDALAASLRLEEDLSFDALEELAASLVESDLDKLAGDLVLASTIAAPGALHPTEIQNIINGQRSVRRIWPESIAAARAEFFKTAWPPLVNLPLSPVLAWLRRIPGFEEGVPSGNLGRAVAALSHLLGYEEAESGGAGLMWAMIGLEALYTRGREALSEQLREKAQVLLGAPKSHAKRFKGLYDYRSKFIHGGLNIPLVYTPYDAVDAFMRSELDTYHAELTAIALLIATLQKMVMEGRTDLEFHWVLRPVEERTKKET